MSIVTENVVFLNRGDYATCTIHLFGGTITSWRIKNKEILYLKKLTIFNNILSIRGGIKFCFPYFGRPKHGPKHGFPHVVKWHLDSGPNTLENGDIEVTLSLEQTEYTKSLWCYKFKLIHKLTLGLHFLKTVAILENTCDYFPFVFNLSQYNVFQVADIKKCEILNLANSYKKAMDSETKREIVTTELNDDGNVVVQRKYQTIFIDTGGFIELRNFDENDPKLKLRITSKRQYATNDILIVNPWDQIGEKLFDDDKHEPDEYLHFIGISTGNFSKTIRLEPKEKWEAMQMIEYVDEEWLKRMKMLTALLSNPWEMLKNKC